MSILSYTLARTARSVYNRGQQIFNEGKVTLVEQNNRTNKLQFWVKSQTDETSNYQVSVKLFKNRTHYTYKCNCAYAKNGGICKHVVAATFYINTQASKKKSVPMRSYASLVSNFEAFENQYPELKDLAFDEFEFINEITPYTHDNPELELVLGLKFTAQQNTTKISLDRQSKTITMQCDCGLSSPNSSRNYCYHMLGGLLYLKEKYGLFTPKISELKETINPLLNQYGFDFDDAAWEKHIEIYWDKSGQPQAKLLTPNLANLGQLNSNAQAPVAQKFTKGIIEQMQTCLPDDELPIATKNNTFGAVVFLVLNNCGGTLKITIGNLKSTGNVTWIKEADTSLRYYDVFLEMVGIQSTKWLKGKKEEYNNTKEKLHYRREHFDTQEAYITQMHQLARQILFMVDTTPTLHFGIAEESLRGALKGRIYTIDATQYECTFYIKEKDGLYWLTYRLSMANGQPLKYDNIELINQWVINHTRQTIGIFANPYAQVLRHQIDANLFETLPVKIGLKNYVNGLIAQISPEIKFEPPANVTTQHTKMEPIGRRVYIVEQVGEVRFEPTVVYLINGSEIELQLHKKYNIIEATDNNNVVEYVRNHDWESEFAQLLTNLHPSFEHGYLDMLYLSIGQLIEKGWFFELNEKLQEAEVELFGQKDLKQFRININRPKISTIVSSGIDWFDVEVEVTFGDQKANLKEIKKAVKNKDQFVKLKDGTLGELPQKWIKRFEKMLRLGTEQKKGIRINHRQALLLENEEPEFAHNEQLKALRSNINKLAKARKMDNCPLPTGLKATLRPYQKQGYYWLAHLQKIGWGGILADDMGLGKTLQALAAIVQSQTTAKEQKPSLVVVPNSLLFNWISEVEKFTTNLEIYLHHGPQRQQIASKLPKKGIILTSYGTLRQDVDMLKNINFNYAVLDESQAIKNPLSLVSKATRLIQAKHKLVMTGTPIENSTFDLYSQMDFVNPGLLGSAKMFKENYAMPIERDNNQERSDELKKLIDPFIIRRTKENVAKDLPDKTETTIWCEMTPTQRSTYEACRQACQNEIMGEIEENGLEKAGMKILKGLTKLRQICNSPVFYNPYIANPVASSGKLTELMQELKEVSTHHKVLVFSQFTKTLALLAEANDKAGIGYTYLDGKTTNRKEVVDGFMQNQQQRVFLISLKAGGTGLNLTAAEYVYIVDPWWNPAVEQQAIDRVYRIGQNKPVFAYRLVCKNSIEEKILELQARKNTLATDIVSAQTGLLKNLDTSAVLSLFS